MSYENFELKVIICPKCNKKMIDAEYWKLFSVFPIYHKKALKIQLSKRNMVVRSEIKNNDYAYVCKTCIGLAEFKCYSCKEQRLIKNKKYTHGDPPDHLCKECFNTKTAKEWEDLEDEIVEKHQWDYE